MMSSYIIINVSKDKLNGKLAPKIRLLTEGNVSKLNTIGDDY
jgi:hypothetical protein